MTETQPSPPAAEPPTKGAGPESGAAGGAKNDAKPASPMMVQYLRIKADHRDCLLFYRMGDFYEMFFGDAVAAAAALDITLTKRGKHEGQDIPMCGVPFHAAENYTARLIRKGFRVAICEQVEEPAEAKKRGPKAVVRRQVTRLITAGTLTEDTLLEARHNNYLAAVARAGDDLAVAWLDISTGGFAVQSVAREMLSAELSRIDPGELLVADRLIAEPGLFEFFADWKDRLTPRPDSVFDSRGAERRLCALFKVVTLDAFGVQGRAELAALGAVIEYVELTQKGRLPLIRPPSAQGSGAAMAIDGATRRNLELVRALSGERKGSLLSTLDRTVTGAGARLLARRLAAPLTDVAEINLRLDMVQFMAEQGAPRDNLRQRLKGSPDVERALSRLAVGRGGPRDLAVVGQGLKVAGELREQLSTNSSGAPGGQALTPLPEGLAALAGELGHHRVLVERLSRALAPELPVLVRDGGFIALGYHAGLDELRLLRDESRRLIAGLEADYRKTTGIQSLKVKHNNVLGYHIDVTPTHADKLMSDQGFIHRQTLASSVRFTTTELADLAQKISRAADQALALEAELFEDLRFGVTSAAAEIGTSADALAVLDVTTALAALAEEENYCRPRVDSSLGFEILGGRHPVVERALAAGRNGTFVANDCDLGPGTGEGGGEGGDGQGGTAGRRLWLLTGPNMAGKSTFLRQNALIAIMAQAGAFVPAGSAHIGVVDRLFSRVGAADDLARGRSTFMVEMVETAAILNQAGERALVILDEIGRGTATFDGLSIAWAVVEHLHEINRCRALFATHYHELTALSAKLPGLANHALRVKEWQGDVVFLHEVVPGAADRSYGIHVARLAGLPEAVVARAEHVLETLESSDSGAGTAARLAEDLPLFSVAVATPTPATAAQDAIRRVLEGVAPDELSPKEALELIYRLRDLL